jgi:hypothetical protein
MTFITKFWIPVKYINLCNTLIYGAIKVKLPMTIGWFSLIYGFFNSTVSSSGQRSTNPEPQIPQETKFFMAVLSLGSREDGKR